MMLRISKGTGEYIDNGNYGVGFMLNSDRAVSIIIPVARTGDVESALGFLHEQTIHNELEVLVLLGEPLEDLVANLVR